MENKKGKFLKVKKFMFWSALVVFILGLVYIAFLLFNTYLFPEVNDEAPSSLPVSSEPELPDNPINFEAEAKKYPDIYAWIYIPNTNINYPVVQSPDNDEYYLNHSAEKKYKRSGAIYSEMRNRKDFTDPNTILYGHNMMNGSMFQNLHKFRKDQKFFDENKYIYIYTPGHVLTYEICAAYRYDNRHLLNSFNFKDPAVFEDYLETVKNPKSMISRTRQVELGKDSKILTLSTCIGNHDYRYLVQGVLIKDELTK